jgi:hypothetical protein
VKAFAVKHIEQERGPLSSIMKKVKKQPYVYTSKSAEAFAASSGGTVYMLEVIRDKKGTSYRLGYKFKAGEHFKKAGGALWECLFEYKITGTYPYHLDGMYFDEPVLIEDEEFNSWFKQETLGMCEIPAEHVQTLEKVFSEPSNSAKWF